MKIRFLVWDLRNLEHVARHRIEKEEVEEILERFHLVRMVWKGRYALWGQTHSGRYLMVFMDYLGQGRAYVVTARDLNEEEKHRFRKHL